ncbi:MAG: hypothetical protein GY716_20670 [bacterium]|nr:hypothetical protein [bacterium]
MAKLEQIGSDLSYVRSALDRAEKDGSGSPPAILYLWAAIGLVGFTLFDFMPREAGIFWSIAGPAGGAISFALGWRWGRRLGQGSLRDARNHALHWGTLLVAIGLAVPLHVTGSIDAPVLGRIILLILAVSYFTAGIYLVPSFLWTGLVLGAGYVSLFFYDAYTWTVLGVLFAASLVWAARGARIAPEE